jgi:hypothetical protein
MDELMPRRIYGADYDDPGPGPQPGQLYRELVAGPLDGLLVDVTSWTPGELRGGAALSTEIGAYGPGGHAVYEPVGDPQRWGWQGDTP